MSNQPRISVNNNRMPQIVARLVFGGTLLLLILSVFLIMFTITPNYNDVVSVTLGKGSSVKFSSLNIQTTETYSYVEPTSADFSSIAKGYDNDCAADHGSLNGDVPSPENIFVVFEMTERYNERRCYKVGTSNTFHEFVINVTDWDYKEVSVSDQDTGVIVNTWPWMVSFSMTENDGLWRIARESGSVLALSFLGGILASVISWSWKNSK